MRVSSRRAAVGLALGGLAVTAAAGLVPGAAADTTTTTTTTYSADCSARLLYVELGGNEIPLYDGTSGCGKDDSIIGPVDLSPLPVQADLLYQRTGAQSAEAGVAHIYLPLKAASGGQFPDITVDVLTSQASCSQGQPTGSSHVLKVDVAGYGSFEAPQDLQLPNPIDLDPIPLVISMNQQDTPPDTTTHTGPTTSGNTTTSSTSVTKHLTQTALEIVSPGLLDVVVARSHVDCTRTDTTTTTTTPPPPPPPPAKDHVVSWMSGGGQLNANLTHSLVLPCTTNQSHPKPKLNVETPTGTFRLDTLGDVHCSMDPNAGSPEQPDAGFNTLTGSGTGTCNGVSGIPVRFRFTDEGEPNQGRDKASIQISGPVCPVNATGTVNGNQQAHRSGNPPA
jgi:hypothetical protein